LPIPPRKEGFVREKKKKRRKRNSTELRTVQFTSSSLPPPPPGFWRRRESGERGGRDRDDGHKLDDSRNLKKLEKKNPFGWRGLSEKGKVECFF